MEERPCPVREKKGSFRHPDRNGQVLERERWPVGRGEFLLTAAVPDEEQGERDQQEAERSLAAAVPFSRFFSYHRFLI
jgi:hypothetical protein